jgi:uncharacterized protein (TIGR00251 family)
MTEAASAKIVERDGGIRFDIVVAPRASRERVGPVMGEAIKVAVTAPPVEGKANDAVVALLARKLGVRQNDVRIIGGERGKRKSVQVTGASRAALLALLGEKG